ncbi:ATP-binding protein [Ideonella sp.]|uniref:sensor histidine kinase n=1 Tax=Ideonella sp. TaxID=1929293 RepID=UPI0035B3B419
MRSLYVRIWLTVVAALALFALVSGWLLSRHLEHERQRAESVLSERMAAWGDMIQASLPGPAAPADEQAAALRDWSRRLRVPLALHDVQGVRIAASESYLRRESESGAAGPAARRAFSVRLEDGRVLWLMRPNLGRLQRGIGPDGPDGPGPAGPPPEPPPPGEMDGRAPAGAGAGGPPPEFGPRDLRLDLPRPQRPSDWLTSLGLVALLALLFLAVAGGAWPVVRRLTWRLEQLKQGVEAFGAGALHHRVPDDGRDEVAAVAASFNRAAAQVEALVRSHQSLLANASHELRSPLARLKMAVALMEDAPPALQASLRREIDIDIGELDALVEEVLLSSRLDAGAVHDLGETVDWAGVVAEEASRIGAELQTEGPGPWQVTGSERLLRRAARNLLENARRYGGAEVTVRLQSSAGGGVELHICDRGPGVPADLRERIFEPFYRLPGHAEREGGVGLGLALVRQIALAHRGQVRCDSRDGGGSCFVLSVPVAAPSASAR